MKRTALTYIGFFIAILALTGCPPKKKLAMEEKPKEEVAQEEKAEESIEMKEPGVSITQDWTEIPALTMVNFDLNSAALDEAARNILKKNVSILKKLPPSVTVRVEGHCDERGTVEYNLALGQRRATAVRSYYATSGISGKRLETISFGMERPMCNTHDEGCWAKNRRGVTKVRNAETITIKDSDLE